MFPNEWASPYLGYLHDSFKSADFSQSRCTSAPFANGRLPMEGVLLHEYRLGIPRFVIWLRTLQPIFASVR
jgi:hypothetical protein